MLVRGGLVVFALSGPAEAQPAIEMEQTAAVESNDVDNGPTTVALARALDERMTVWRGRRRRVYVRHCRQAREGCRARLVMFSRLIVEAAQRHQVDPFLIAAMALRESGLNPFAEGGIGERGIVQLHPRGAGARVRFVQNDAYRARCERNVGACQEEVIDAGARLIAAAIQRCGSVQEGLGCYNTGICQTTRYSERVLSERQRLLRLAKADVVVAPAMID